MKDNLILQDSRFYNVVGLVYDERERQRRSIITLNIPYDCSDPSVEDYQKMLVLMEEIGEVSKTIVDYSAYPSESQTGNDRLKEELVQVAAVAFAWLESMDDEAR